LADIWREYWLVQNWIDSCCVINKISNEFIHLATKSLQRCHRTHNYRVIWCIRYTSQQHRTRERFHYEFGAADEGELLNWAGVHFYRLWAPLEEIANVDIVYAAGAWIGSLIKARIKGFAHHSCMCVYTRLLVYIATHDEVDLSSI
jgi:hypothetical protein